MKLYQIIAPTFVTGLITDGSAEQVVRCAPILRGRFLFEALVSVKASCQALGWELSEVGTFDIEAGKLEVANAK